MEKCRSALSNRCLESTEETFVSGSAAVQLHQLTPLWAPLTAHTTALLSGCLGSPLPFPTPSLRKASRSGSCQGMETRGGGWGLEMVLYPEHPRGMSPDPHDNEEWELKTHQHGAGREEEEP